MNPVFRVPPNAAPAAPAAFLRGVERRSAVLAELQCGDAATGDAAVSTTMLQFAGRSGQWPLSDWPTRFWALLLAQPRLRARTRLALPLDASDGLAELGNGPRAALLLRLAAGLSEAQAAAVLRVSNASYRLALQRGLPQGPDGRPDPQAWQRLRDEVHGRIKTLPPARLVRLAQAREQAMGGASTQVHEAAAGAEPRRRGLLAVLWLLLALCAAGFVATFREPVVQDGGAAPARRVHTQALPPAAPAASRYGAEAAVITHPDYALLSDPEGMAAAPELAFMSWLAAGDPSGLTLEQGAVADAGALAGQAPAAAGAEAQ